MNRTAAFYWHSYGSLFDVQNKGSCFKGTIFEFTRLKYVLGLNDLKTFSKLPMGALEFLFKMYKNLWWWNQIQNTIQKSG